MGQARTNSATFFRNTDCAYFPCHSGVDPDDFNCLFCYCPLYALGPDCGGRPSYTQSGIKDCTACTMLHDGDGGAAIVKRRFADLAALARADRNAATSAGAIIGKGSYMSIAGACASKEAGDTATPTGTQEESARNKDIQP